MADHLDAPTIYRLGPPVLGVPVIGVSYQGVLVEELPAEPLVVLSEPPAPPSVPSTHLGFPWRRFLKSRVRVVPPVLPAPVVVPPPAVAPPFMVVPDPRLDILQSQLDALTARVAWLELPWYRRAWIRLQRWYEAR